MAINYTCHLCLQPFEAISDEYLEEIKRELMASGGEMPRYITFECDHCKKDYPLHIATLLSEGD